MGWSVLEENSYFKILRFTFSSKSDYSRDLKLSLLIKLRFRALVCSMQFLSPEVVPYLYKTTTRPCMEYYCLVRAGASAAT